MVGARIMEIEEEGKQLHHFGMSKRFLLSQRRFHSMSLRGTMHMHAKQGQGT